MFLYIYLRDTLNKDKMLFMI